MNFFLIFIKYSIKIRYFWKTLNMAIAVSFSTNQTVGNPSIINVVDSSSGTDVTAVTRRVYLQNDAGNYIVPSGNPSADFILWPLPNSAPLSIDVLKFDMALFVRLEYVTVGGTVANGATLTQLQGYSLYNEQFYYTLTQAQAQQNSPPPMIIQDNSYYSNKSIFRVNIDSGNQAVTLANDIKSAQQCYDLATYMRLQEAKSF